jgi:putative membrane protein
MRLCAPQILKSGPAGGISHSDQREGAQMTTKRITSRVSIYRGIVLLAILAASVQRGSGQSTASPQPAYNQPTLPGLGVAGPVTTVPHSFGDEAFVRSVLERDAGDLQLGQLAQQKSGSADVKQLAQKIAAARTNLDAQFKPIAQSFEVSQPRSPAKKDKQLIAKLEALSGPQFDEEFLKALAKMHRQDIKDFGAEAQTAQDPRIQTLAQQDGGELSQQLQSIQQVAQAHNVTLDAKN